MAKILIVDDAAYMRLQLKDILSKGGYGDICEAANGVRAVEMYKEHEPALVLMDCTMPKMNGLEALKAIKAVDDGACVVVCYKRGQESMLIDAIKSGAKDFIMKPYKQDRIIRTVSNFLDC